MSRRAARVDTNQREIVAALRQMGASVQLLHTVGAGCPDILVGWRGNGSGPVNLLVEIKDGAKPASARKLTPAEADFHAAWRGQVAIVETIEDAIALLQEAAPCQ